VTDFGIGRVIAGCSIFARPNAFARLGVGVIHGEIVLMNG
jgi:hypothetical protein